MKKLILLILTIILTFALLPFYSSVRAEAPLREYGADLAFKRRVVSSPNTDQNLNINAVDNDPSSRYAAVKDDSAFFYVDLGSVEKIGKVVIAFEAAYAKKYLLQLSNDALTWTTVATVTNTKATVNEIIFPEYLEAKFVRFQGVERGMVDYGYSFWSFEVYGPKNLAVGANVVFVSSNENEVELNKSCLTDGLAHTRWASGVADGQYVIIDLLEAKTFDLIKIRWEVSFARRFAIYGYEGTPDGAYPERDDASWFEIERSDVGLGEVDTFKLDGDQTTRFIKLELIQRETNEVTKKTGRFPWESTFSIYEFEIYDWDAIHAAPLGSVMEFSKAAPAWTAMANITLNESGLLLAPIGYPIEADGKVTDLASIASGDIPGFESYAVYNPAVIYDEEREMFHMIYRAELPDNFHHYFGDKYPLGHMSSLAYAFSLDGINWERGAENPIAWATSADEKGGGLEDPRMFKIENDPNRGGLTTYYITYTMYDNNMTREGIIYTHDFVTFTKVGRLAPDYPNNNKSGTYVTDPEGNAVLINDPRPGKTGKVYMIYMKDGGYTRIGFTTDVIRIEAEDIIDIDTSGFGSNHIEALTKGNESCMALTNIYGEEDQDIYLMYGGGVLSDPEIKNQQPNASGWFYALGVLKTTKANPFELTHFDYDLNEPSMYPTDTNKIDYGLFDKCMFADSLIRHDNQWYLYYGAGDMYVGAALARADFTAPSATYELEGTTLIASTTALNKKYKDEMTPLLVEFAVDVYNLDGTLLDTVVKSYEIEHFTISPIGIYEQGTEITVAVDLTKISALETDYYVIGYIRDQLTKERLNNPSSYLHVTPVIVYPEG